MSILIKGMEMPQEMKTTLTIFPDGRVYENHGERLRGYGEDCIPWKAVPVPPHGRLIDADALHFVKGFEEDDPLDYIRRYAIEKAPTIIPADKEGE